MDPDKVGEVATKVAMKISEGRSKVKVLPDLDEVVELAKECTECEWCDRVCPNSIPNDGCCYGMQVKGTFPKCRDFTKMIYVTLVEDVNRNVQEIYQSSQ